MTAAAGMVLKLLLWKDFAAGQVSATDDGQGLFSCVKSSSTPSPFLCDDFPKYLTRNFLILTKLETEGGTDFHFHGRINSILGHFVTTVSIAAYTDGSITSSFASSFASD